MPTLTISSFDGGAFSAAVFWPQVSETAPAVLVIQEFFGITPPLIQICEKLAQEGCIAVCPHLFWRQGSEGTATHAGTVDWSEAFRIYKSFNVEAGLSDLIATLDAVRGLAACNGKVGALGFGFGGRLALHLASRSDIDCAVGFHPIGIEAALDESAHIRKPVMLHVSEKDLFTPQTTLQKIRAALDGHRSIRIESYPAAEHGFAYPGGQNYQEEAAARAAKKTMAFFARHLGTGSHGA